MFLSWLNSDKYPTTYDSNPYIAAKQKYLFTHLLLHYISFTACEKIIIPYAVKYV